MTGLKAHGSEAPNPKRLKQVFVSGFGLTKLWSRVYLKPKIQKQILNTKGTNAS